MWYYLFIACFDWKVGVFQQTVVRVYYILKWTSISLTELERAQMSINESKWA